MKTYDEITNGLLERRDAYISEKNRKRKAITGVVTSLCCFCLVALVCIGVWQGGALSTDTPEQTLGDALYPDIQDVFDETMSETDAPTAPASKIIFNELGGRTEQIMNIALMSKDFVEMTNEELIAYYGVDFFPALPEGMKQTSTDGCGIFKRNGGTGEVYWDADRRSYESSDGSKWVCVNVDKNNRVFQQFLMFRPTDNISVINGIEVMLGITEDNVLYTEFMHKGAGFLISAEGLTQDEFTAVVTSLTD